MYRTIAALIAEGARRGARPRNDAAESEEGRLMSQYKPTGDKPTDRDAEPPALRGEDISDVRDADGEQIAVFERDRVVTGGNFMHVHPRDCIPLEECR